MNDAAPDRLALLSQIGELIPPDPIELGPQTPLAWLLAALLLTGIVLAILGIIRRYRRNSYRRQALASLGGLKDRGAEMLAALPAILRWTAIRGFSGHPVVTLSGAAWLDFLCQRCDGNAADRARLARIVTLAYVPPVELDRIPLSDQSALRAVVRDWIRRHRRHD